jgi:DNA repair and recombination protein RAD52
MTSERFKGKRKHVDVSKETSWDSSTTASEEERIADIGEELGRYLGPEYISYRKGDGNSQYAYLEGHEAISIANRIFGFDGWRTEVKCFTIDYAEQVKPSMKWNIGIACTMRVTVLLREKGEVREVYHEDVGYGTTENAPYRGKAIENCRKEAVTDGIKRGLRQFGNSTGNCLYNNLYRTMVKKARGPAERIEFVEDELFCKPMNKRQRLIMKEESAQAIQLRAGKDVVQEFDEFGLNEDLDDDWMTQMHVVDELHSV